MNTAVGLIPAADVPVVQPADGQVLNLTVPALDLNLLGLNLETTPINVRADALEGNGNLLGNVLTSLLNTLDATPDKVLQEMQAFPGTTVMKTSLSTEAEAKLKAAFGAAEKAEVQV